MPKIVKSGIVYGGGSTLPASNVSFATSGTRITSTTAQSAIKELATTGSGSLTLTNTSAGSITYANSHEVVVLSLDGVTLKNALAAGSSVALSTLGTTIRPKVATNGAVYTFISTGATVTESTDNIVIAASNATVCLKISCTTAGALSVTNNSGIALPAGSVLNGQFVFIKV